MNNGLASPSSHASQRVNPHECSLGDVGDVVMEDSGYFNICGLAWRTVSKDHSVVTVTQTDMHLNMKPTQDLARYHLRRPFHREN